MEAFSKMQPSSFGGGGRLCFSLFLRVLVGISMGSTKSHQFSLFAFKRSPACSCRASMQTEDQAVGHCCLLLVNFSSERSL